MAEILPPFVLHVAPDSCEVVAATPGPAGSVAATLAPGVVIELDAADPGTLTSLTLDPDLSHPSAEIVSGLLGPEIASEALASLPGPPRLLGSRQSSRSAFVSPGLVEMVLCSDLLDRPDTLVSHRPVIQLAAFLAAARIGVPADHLAPSSEELSAALSCVDSALWQVLEPLRGEARLAGFDLGPAPAAPPTRVGHPPHLRTVEPVINLNQGFVAIDPSSAAFAGASAHLTEQGNVAVRVKDGALLFGVLWARVRRVSDNVVVAAVPCVAQHQDLVALLLTVPSDDLVVDLVKHPDQLPTTAPVAASLRAMALGRQAARFERLGYPAAELWRECANWHEQAGDLSRAKLAGFRARTPQMPQRTFLADHLF